MTKEEEGLNLEKEVVEGDMAGVDKDVVEEAVVEEQKETILNNILLGCQMKKYWIVTPCTISHLMSGNLYLLMRSIGSN